MKIASFNVRRLGLSKLSDKNVVKYLIKIVSRYSIIVILEVVDKTGKAMARFLQELNRSNKKNPYSMVVSSSLGRTTYKEQFVCLYRKDQAKLVDTYQYEDNQEGDEDAFSREPFILRFSLPSTSKYPDDMETPTPNIMILGDFNADGAYVSKKKMKDIRIRTDSDFHWLIGDDVDTTASLANDYTYDRKMDDHKPSNHQTA
uniref:Deoxyribonuclease 1 like 4, tandem duplicate 2 n=1 Tax=Astyanax mexicanus TaxID=7994 RepID=A0A8B9KFU4_ASTMX